MEEEGIESEQEFPFLVLLRHVANSNGLTAFSVAIQLDVRLTIMAIKVVENWSEAVIMLVLTLTLVILPFAFRIFDLLAVLSSSADAPFTLNISLTAVFSVWLVTLSCAKVAFVVGKGIYYMNALCSVHACGRQKHLLYSNFHFIKLDSEQGKWIL